MKMLHDRINAVIHSGAFHQSLEDAGIELFEFQANWYSDSQGHFERLPVEFQNAILAGEREVGSGNGVLDLMQLA